MKQFDYFQFQLKKFENKLTILFDAKSKKYSSKHLILIVYWYTFRPYKDTDLLWLELKKLCNSEIKIIHDNNNYL